MILAYIDGGARGNPGPAGYGVRVEDMDGNLIEELHGAMGIATNNVAEYNGLLAALKWAVDHGQRDVHIRTWTPRGSASWSRATSARGRMGGS